ncbi:large ribosomal subunit protein mL50 [Euwallacea fornicatus]|uniref:large ribosomal subunit protein mL50 n=1 Tax=Euwallacea fornicatus TaxID=995702 RepID=UPI00338E46D4
MAAFFRHGVSKTAQVLPPKNVLPRSYATKAEKKKGIDRKPTPKLDSTMDSIAAKGFLRPIKPYTPPPDVEITLTEIFKGIIGKSELDTKVVELNDRFKLFSACAAKLGHSIPNSLLHQIETLEQVLKFYATPVDTRTPLDKMRSMELPENLHVQFEYCRWNPMDDKKFKGITAFPESSTIITSIRYKDKYKGHIQKPRAPPV